MNLFEILHDEFKFTHRPIKLFEAFSGYGSQFMALKRLGVEVEVVGYSEIDKYAIKVYEALHGTHKNYGGIGSFDRFPKGIDICTWSFPCQDISLAGKQRGMENGSRSNYGYVFLDTVEATPHNERPKVLLMENVRALFSEKFRDDWREIQLRLERLGYTSYSDILNAKDYGVAQNRERVFIVSILGEYYYEFPKPYKLKKRLKDYLEDEVDEKYYLSDNLLAYMTDKKDRNGFVRGNRFNPHKDVDGYAFAITASAGNRPTDNFIVDGVINYAPKSREYDEEKWSDISPTLCARDYKDPKIVKVKTWNDETKVYKTREADMPRHRIYETDSIGFTITTNESQQPMIATKNKYSDYSIKKIKNNIVDKEDVVGTITANAMQSFNHDNCHMIHNDLRIRKLTPREALRLMDVSETDIDIMLSQVSDTQAYKLAGNSIVVNVLVEIFRKLFEDTI